MFHHHPSHDPACNPRHVSHGNRPRAQRGDRSRLPRPGIALTCLASAALVLGTIGLVGCGGNTDAAGGDAVAEVRIGSDDQMRFDRDQFTVQAGQTVRLTLEHTGQMAVEQMGHNVAILNRDEDPVAFGTEVGREGGNIENEYLPESMRDRVIAFTRMIGGGETDTIEFTAPDQAGEYPFVCTFPGHYAIMRGVMTVQE